MDDSIRDSIRTQTADSQVPTFVADRHYILLHLIQGYWVEAKIRISH